MKKILLTMAFVLTALGNAWADEVSCTDNVSIPQGSAATLEILLKNDIKYRQGVEFFIELPAGVELLAANVTTRLPTANIKFNSAGTQKWHVLAWSTDDKTIGTNKKAKAIIEVQLRADPSLVEGTTLTGENCGKITNMEMTYPDNTPFKPDDMTFGISIGTAREYIDLWDDQPLPNYTDPVDVVVHRSIKSGQWSTICLPFDMSEVQVKEVFGDDVKLGEFTEWSYDGELPEVDAINLVFTPVDAILKQRPYVINVSKSISSFKVQNVSLKNIKLKDIELDLDGEAYGYMKGVLESTIVPENDIFLANNLFWSSTGNTTIKGFRAYLHFQPDPDNPESTIIFNEDNASRISMSFDEEATKIKDIRASEDDNSIYNLSGQKLERLNKKGLYIKGGKKVVIK